MASSPRFRRARPRLAAVLGIVALSAAAGLGGWLVYAGSSGASPSLTSAPLTEAVRVEPPPPPAPPELQARLEALAERYREAVGVAVTDVDAGWTAQVRGEEIFPQQSVSKLWVALSVMEAVDQGRLRLDQPVTLTREDRSVFYQPVTSLIRGPEGYTTDIQDLLRRQLVQSDNAASDKLMAVVGGAGVVGGMLAAKRLDGIAVGASEREMQTRTAGLTWQPDYGVTWIFKQARAQLPDSVRDAALDAYLAAPADGATPVGITRALAALHRGELLSPGSTAVMLDLMAQCRTGNSRLKAGLPADWRIGHKTGTGPDWRGGSVGINDVGLITAPDGRTYAVAVMMRETRASFRARNAFMQAVSRAVVEHWRETSTTQLAAG